MKRRQTRVAGNTCVYYVMYVSVENALLGHKASQKQKTETSLTGPDGASTSVPYRLLFPVKSSHTEC